MDDSICRDKSKILELCYEIEITTSQIYELLASAHASWGSVSELWEKTSLEEVNHANQFKLAKKLRDSIIADVTVDLCKAEDMLARVKAYRAEIRTVPPSVIDALKAAVEWELALAEFHSQTALVFKEESFARLFDAMMAADRYHIAALQDALERLSSASEKLAAKPAIEGTETSGPGRLLPN